VKRWLPGGTGLSCHATAVHARHVCLLPSTKQRPGARADPCRRVKSRFEMPQTHLQQDQKHYLLFETKKHLNVLYTSATMPESASQRCNKMRGFLQADESVTVSPGSSDARLEKSRRVASMPKGFVLGAEPFHAARSRRAPNAKPSKEGVRNRGRETTFSAQKSI
jgi:hypothetical protein